MSTVRPVRRVQWGRQDKMASQERLVRSVRRAQLGQLAHKDHPGSTEATASTAIAVHLANKEPKERPALLVRVGR